MTKRPMDGEYFAACDPDTIRALVQRVKDAENAHAMALVQWSRDIERVEQLGQACGNTADDLVRVEQQRGAARAERDDLAAKVAALADRLDEQAHIFPDNRLLPEGVAITLRALLGGDTSALDKRLAEHGERIAAAIEALPNPDRCAVTFVREDAARIARAGGPR